MKKNLIPIMGMLLMLLSCEKDSDSDNSTDTPQKMEDLEVSENFTWKTTHNAVVTLPDSVASKGKTIYIVDDNTIYYKGSSQNSEVEIVLPTYLNSDQLKVYTSDPFKPSAKSGKAADSDGDGVKDNKDDFPNDPNRAYINMFPPTAPGTLVYEDLWPSKGDYDFNDMVIDYQAQINTNASNQVTEIIATVTLRATGAGYHNAFAFELPNLTPNNVINVSGYSVNDPLFNIAANGTEAGQSALNVVVFDDAYNVLQHAGGTGINVDPLQTYVQPVDVTINMQFFDNGQFAPGGPISINDFTSFDPYIIANVNSDGRGREIHLPGQFPTDLADTSYFNSYNDDTNPVAYDGSPIPGGWIKTYESHGNYPWAMNFYDNFSYMIEKNSILLGYLKFSSWAENGSNPNWYKINNPAFRNNQYIY